MMDAIILAGGKMKGLLANHTGSSYKALIEIKGKFMLRYIIDILRESKFIDRIIVVGPKFELENIFIGRVDKVVEEKRIFLQNLISGLEEVELDKKVLILPCDMPLITQRSIDDFIEQCKKVEADIYFPVVRKELVEEKFPGTQRTYVKLIEGVFTGGNMMIVKPSIILSRQVYIQRVYEARKNPYKLSLLLGISFICKLLLKKLSLKQIEERAKKILRCNCIAIFSDYPEIAVDVDKISDLQFVELML